MADKGYHSNDTILAVQQAEARSYMPEPTRPGRRWAGKADEQRAVYANRRRIHGNYGKRLLKKRGELIERSFAHCYDTGGMRRVFLRGRENALKRQLIHVGAFNLSLVFRQTLGAGTPRELRNRQQRATLLILYFRIALAMNCAPSAVGLRRLKHPTGNSTVQRSQLPSSDFAGLRHGLLSTDVTVQGSRLVLALLFQSNDGHTAQEAAEFVQYRVIERVTPGLVTRTTLLPSALNSNRKPLRRSPASTAS